MAQHRDDDMTSSMQIGAAAQASGVSVKMIRHYEALGLLPPAARSAAGYRRYGERDVHALCFIRHARDLGFSLGQIQQLLDLWRDRRRPSREVKALAQAHIDELDAKLRELQAMKQTLVRLTACCHGDDRPDCPLSDTLAGGPEARHACAAQPGH